MSETTAFGLTLLVLSVVWLYGYLTGYWRARLKTLAEFKARQDDLLRQLADLQRTVDAVDWLYSPEEERGAD